MGKSAYSHLYNNSRWRKRRLRQLQAEPLCRYCAKAGRVTAATVADHIDPHKGDPIKFDGPIQSLCKPCHDSIKAREESGKGRLGCDASGFPNNVGHLWRTSANTGGDGRKFCERRPKHRSCPFASINRHKPKAT